jgi:hypothetical protein
MKFLGILAAASLALSPAIASAGSDSEGDEKAAGAGPISGPLAGRPLPDKVPPGAIIAAGVVIIGGAIICVIACGGKDSNNNTNN